MNIACVVIAGSNPDRVDSVAQYAGVTQKALIPIAGKPMIVYVLDAILNSNQIKKIVVVGLSNIVGYPRGNTIDYIDGEDRILNNIVKGVNYTLAKYPEIDHIIITMCDIPLLSSEMINWFINECLSCTCNKADYYWAMVGKATMEKRFPGAGRTYSRMKDGFYCSGDLFMVNAVVAYTNLQLWDHLIESRKQWWRMALVLGFLPLVRLLLGLISTSELGNVLGHAFNITCKIIISPYADHGMDVDKPFQLELVRNFIDCQNL